MTPRTGPRLSRLSCMLRSPRDATGTAPSGSLGTRCLTEALLSIGVPLSEKFFSMLSSPSPLTLPWVIRRHEGTSHPMRHPLNALPAWRDRFLCQTIWTRFFPAARTFFHTAWVNSLDIKSLLWPTVWRRNVHPFLSLRD